MDRQRCRQALRGNRFVVRGRTVIRQAISCDICGTEMQHPNHWFVTYDQGPELRVSGWNSRVRLRAGAKHLCGQTCLHKLVDEFMARTQNLRVSALADKAMAGELSARAKGARAGVMLPTSTAKPLTASAATYDDLDVMESSARLIAPSDVAEMPAAAARTLRAEAWKREREREQRASEEQRPAIARRRSIA